MAASQFVGDALHQVLRMLCPSSLLKAEWKIQLFLLSLLLLYICGNGLDQADSLFPHCAGRAADSDSDPDGTRIEFLSFIHTYLPSRLVDRKGAFMLLLGLG